MKKSIIFCLFCLSSSLMAMESISQPKSDSGWNDSYEQRCVAASCFSIAFCCAAVAVRQELADQFQWNPVTVNDQVVSPFCPLALTPICSLAGATQLDYDPNHSCCYACLRHACGSRSSVMAPQAQEKME